MLEMRTEDRKGLVMGSPQGSRQSIGVIFKRVSQAELYNYCVLNPSPWAALPSVFVLLFVGTLSEYGISLVKWKSSHPSETRKADLHPSL